MASLAWLVAIAERKSKAQADEMIAAVSQGRREDPADPRALWDWFYLSLLRYDNAASLAAGKRLSAGAPNDPLALWAYLYSLGGRERLTGQRNFVNFNQGQQVKDTTPPLPGGRARPRDGLLPLAASSPARAGRRPRSCRSSSRSSSAPSAPRRRKSSTANRSTAPRRSASLPASSAWRPRRATSMPCSRSATATSGSRAAGASSIITPVRSIFRARRQRSRSA